MVVKQVGAGLLAPTFGFGLVLVSGGLQACEQ